MNIALNSKIFSSCSEAFIEPQNPVEPVTLGQKIKHRRRHLLIHGLGTLMQWKAMRR
jgi:hypothetical protein